MKNAIICILAFIACIAVIFFAFVPAGRRISNKWQAKLIETDVDTSYKAQKEIEDTLRSYIASYEADRITYETNKDANTPEATTLANAAKTRANRTVAVYNEYYLKNSHIWKDNIPADIKTELEYIQ